MFYLAVGLLIAYGTFRAWLDFKQEKEIDDINQKLKEINDSLYSIKTRMRNDREKK